MLMLNTKSCQFSTGYIPCGLVARIRRFHRRGRGSIPRKGAPCFFDIPDIAHACRKPCNLCRNRFIIVLSMETTLANDSK